MSIWGTFQAFRTVLLTSTYTTTHYFWQMLINWLMNSNKLMELWACLAHWFPWQWIAVSRWESIWRLRWPRRVKHKSVYQNTKQFPKTQINFSKRKSVYQNTNQCPKNTNQLTKTQNNFLKHKPIFQNTNQFTKTQINFTKHKPISRNTNQKTGHLLCHYQRAWKRLIPTIFCVQHGDF